MLIFSGKIRSQLTVLVCAIWFLVPLVNADVLDDVKECDSCHGVDGVSTESDIPTIAGASAFVLEEYMYQFREDARPCRESKFRSGDTDRPATDMCTIAKNLDEDEFAGLAEHYSGKTFMAAKQDFDVAKAEAGRSIHKKNCGKCHSDGGSYADDDAGLLAGQWMPYLKETFEDYVAGDRDMMEDKMKQKIEALDAESFDALLHFYASLQ